MIRGERGTAKSTAARALAELLPEVSVVAKCRFRCNPAEPTTWCTECRERAASGEELPSEVFRTSFVDLPVSATEDRVVGTLDIERAIKEGERHFEPGVLASANRGLLYIDEVNLLDDHVVDLLLDSAALGMNIVEREGISFSHPSRYILVGTMNPEEGDLRPQLLDRFALSVDIRGLSDPDDRVAIMERNLAFEQDPVGFRAEWMDSELELSKRIETARQTVDKVSYETRNLHAIAALTSSLNVDGHRADLVILKAAKANAAFEGREAGNIEVGLKSGDDSMALWVKDDGKGMPPSTASFTPGMGMVSMRERAQEMGGELRVESEENRGTTVTVTVPLTRGER